MLRCIIHFEEEEYVGKLGNLRYEYEIKRILNEDRFVSATHDGKNFLIPTDKIKIIEVFED